MKTLLICPLLFFYSICFGQQKQDAKEPIYYVVSGLVYVNEYELANQNQTDNKKIPKSNLKFKIVGKKLHSTGNDSIYIIQFPSITDNIIQGKKGEKDDVGLKGSSIFINSDDNDKCFWIKKNDFELYIKDDFIQKKYNTPHCHFAYGLNISIPFKLRPKTHGQNIKITPDLTLGGYIGLKWRISHTEPYYLTFPAVTAGLATLALNDNTTSPNSNGDGWVLGITKSVGAVFQFSDFQAGVMVGLDRASGEIGKDWIYNNKLWYSFSIGYSFIGSKKQ